MKLVRLITLAAIVGFTCLAPRTVQGQEPTDLQSGEVVIAWDRLEVGRIYRLMTSVEIWAWRYRYDALGPMVVSFWRLFKVHKIDRSDPDDLWYYIQVIPFFREGYRDDPPGWIDADEFKEHGVARKP